MPKNGPFWRVFRKPEACGQTVLPDKKWWKMPKYEKFKCNILSNFQTLWLGSQQLGVTTNHHPFSLSFVALLLINVAQSHNTLLLSTFMAKDNEGRIVSQSLLSSLPTFLLTRSSSSYRENIWLVNYYYLWFILLYVPPCFMWTRLLICSEDIKSDLCPHFPKWITNG